MRYLSWNGDIDVDNVDRTRYEVHVEGVDVRIFWRLISF